MALEIDGAEEAAATACDRLDVPLATITFFEARIALDPVPKGRIVLVMPDVVEEPVVTPT